MAKKKRPMKGRIARLPSSAGVDPEQLWYVPDRRVKTKSAAADAIRIAEQIAYGSQGEKEPEEQELFVALHTCAYRAVRRSRGKDVPVAERIEWVRRWRLTREHIVEKNIGLVYSTISRLGLRQFDEDDLLSDAMLGLTRAVDRFNPWKGYRFSTYACNVIARALIHRGTRERRYRELFPVQFDVSFERPDTEADTRTELYVERLQRVLDGNLGELTCLESKVLAQRFPGDHGSRLTFKQIGSTVGISKERVRQIQNVALRKLRSVLAEDPILQ